MFNFGARVCRAFLIIALPLFVGSCGGVTPEAKIANVIEVILASTLEAFASNTAQSTTIVGKCGNGTGNEGTLSYSIPAAASDPLTLIAFITANPSQVPLPMTFTNCVVRVCGDTVTLNGSTAALVLGISATSLLSGAVPAKFTIQLTALPVTGFISENVTFSYALKAAFTSNTLSSLTIEDATPAVPYVSGGKTYNGADILTLADGC